MPNTNPQAISICNDKIRPLADRVGQLYNLCKALQAEAVAEGWAAMFTGGSGNIIVDGSATDGRAIITDADVAAFITDISSFITDMEAASNARRNRALKIAVNPQQF
jgi:hypothetical protein